ncbi:ABC transporter related protein [Ancylobacter novellus DSM 506]|uniref:ABC transporter related protein n=1 Tax=Ancylobacter novellus (strain ATCC 8093 / DSM 506 / JCM 20403 / CCM 1077 / IAM 12100 / NBRC 12443 / NCIMB 10456) TaxID=639283 RepID=D7A2K5_ANCN5|nr:ABC transporter ATP-binding protein [Ancylobacter novellus]ADH91535.1 ABC transporter related protein [Ancylobacter novellus DSM 506]
MRAPGGMPLLSVEDLTVDFGEGTAKVLSDVSFELRRDEVLGIVGETGAGKSVLARALIDLLPEGGRIVGGDLRLDGASILDMDAAERRQMRGGRIALIGTNAKALLDPVETVGAQIARVLRAHKPCSRKEAWAAAVDLLAQVGIVNPERRARAYPHQLSGGMAQRVVIAMAMVANPEVVLADDATLGLDATIQVQVLDLLVKRCRDLGAGVVLITHDLGIIAHYCDRVAIMKDGRIVELDEVGHFLEAPKDGYSRTLLDAAKVRPTPRTGEAADETGEHAPCLLEIGRLVKTFPISGTTEVVRAIDDVSFSVRKGETLALVGESGSGKTTVGQCLVRLLESDSGGIAFDGTDITNMPAHQFRPLRRRIQMVFQEPYVALNPRWPVRALIGEPLQLDPALDRGARARRARELLDLVHLPARLADSYPHELTAGEQKRVGIARALATGPDFVVFDEPTTALDIRVRAQIIDLVRDLQAEIGMSALFITHDLNSVRSLAHNVAVMRHGKIVEYGETEAIFARPAQDYTRMLLAAELPIEQGAAQRERAETLRLAGTA